MKKMEKKLFKVIANSIFRTAVKQADSACMLFGYEPKKPDNLKK